MVGVFQSPSWDVFRSDHVSGRLVLARLVPRRRAENPWARIPQKSHGIVGPMSCGSWVNRAGIVGRVVRRSCRNPADLRVRDLAWIYRMLLMIQACVASSVARATSSDRELHTPHG